MNVYYLEYIVHKCKNTTGQFLQSLRTSKAKKIEKIWLPLQRDFRLEVFIILAIVRQDLSPWSVNKLMVTDEWIH